MSDRPDTPVSPSARQARVWRWLWPALVAAYAFAALTGQRAWATLSVALLLGSLCWRTGRCMAALVVGLGLAGCALYRPAALFALAYGPPLAAFSFMAWFFARTLRPGVEPLITRVARLEHPELPTGIGPYTRVLTRLWSGCFLLLLALALGLAPVLALDRWSRWVQTLGYLLPGALFLGEYAYRRRRFGDLRHASMPVLIANTVRVVQAEATRMAQPPAGA